MHQSDQYHYEDKENNHLRMNYEVSKADRKFSYATQSHKKPVVSRNNTEKVQSQDEVAKLRQELAEERRRFKQLEASIINDQSSVLQHL